MSANSILRRVTKMRGRAGAEIVRRLTASRRIRRLLRPIGVEQLLYRRRHRYYANITEQYRNDTNATISLAKIREMNLSFTVTAGRTGTFFLYKLFSLLPDTTSLHEPEPAFHTYLRRVENDPRFAKEFLQNYKLPWIASLSTRNYIEFSHVFCKGFLGPLLELGIVPNLILLRRDPRLIALSYFARDAVPERTFHGIEYLLSPRFPGTLPLRGWRRMSDYQLLYWYAIEIERRQRDYSQLVLSAGGTVCDVTATELDEYHRFVDLAKTLRVLDPAVDLDVLRREHSALAAISWNGDAAPISRRYRPNIDLYTQEEEVWRAVTPADPQLRTWVEQRYRLNER